MKFSSAALTASLAALLVLVGGGPASAAGRALDPGDAMYTLNCDTFYDDWQLMSVDATTAFSTKIGPGGGVSTFGGCAGQPAFDPTTNRSYYIQITYDGTDSHWTLASIDVGTGVSTVIDPFTRDVAGTPTETRIEGIAIGPTGLAYAIGSGTLYSLDLATAELVSIGGTVGATFAFAADLTTGEFYAVDRAGEVVQFDDIAVSGATTSLGFLTDPSLDLTDFTSTGVHDRQTLTGVYALQIDEGGTFWIAVANRPGDSSLWSFTPSTLGAPIHSGIFTDDPFYTSAVLIIPGQAPTPLLAATGVEPGAGVLAATMLLVAGLVLVRRRRVEGSAPAA